MSSEELYSSFSFETLIGEGGFGQVLSALFKTNKEV